MRFLYKLTLAQRRTGGTLALMLRPRLNQLPLPVQRYDDPFLPFGKAIIAQTADIVSAYLFDLAAYLALGAAGAVALERTIAYAAGFDAVTILHGPFATPDYVDAASDSGFNVDAVTVLDESLFDAYTESASRGAFVVRRNEPPVIIPLPGNAGVYWQDAGLITMLSEEESLIRLRVTGDDVLYAGRGDDFAERVRAKLDAMKG